MSSLALSFNDVKLTPVHQNGQVWLRTSELAEALGYSDQSGVTRIFARNSDEFTQAMSCTVKLTEQGQAREVRIFSLRGSHLIAMFSRTTVAKQFRKWVLDILDREVEKSRIAITPEQQAKLHEIVANRSQGERKVFAEMWARHNRHFKIAKYSQLLAVHFDDAVYYLESMDLKSKPALVAPESNLEILASDVTNMVMDHYWSMHTEIARLGGKSPEHPKFDDETIVRAVVTRMVDSKRMLLTFSGLTGKPQIQFIPNDSWILNSENIVKIIGDREGPNKSLLPDIIKAAANRLV